MSFRHQRVSRMQLHAPDLQRRFPSSKDSSFPDGEAPVEGLLAAINRKLEGLPLDKKTGASVWNEFT